MKKLILTAIFALIVGSTAASAQSACGTGKLIFNGDDATGIEVPSGCPGMSANHMFRGIRNACPHGFVRFEVARVTRATGGSMTREQRSRGDTRYHIVCDWGRAGAAETQAPAAQAPTAQAAPPAAQPQVQTAPMPQAPTQQRAQTPDQNGLMWVRNIPGAGKI